ncbi:MAG: branched-chain amino acid ABC transporter permease [Rhodopseudomonas palustris]|uniref:Branched-chain amino acid ABC transporter permease n=1 Tax=Rhodopseudomonas palustris TaxID=1076 RepID=A0A933RUQ6_RHOPL|nr:branched-chain amino acid ABC transporter permease [Rhodopseudomonas palustris]
MTTVAETKDPSPRSIGHGLPLACFAAVAFATPFLLSGNRYLAFVAGVTMIHILWASGMNLLYGYTGLMPLMFAGLAGISAYMVVGLTAAGWSFWLALPVGALAASIAGTILGLPSLRLKGFYFTLCSLVIQTVVTLAFVYFSGLTNGDTGISQIPLPSFAGTPLSGLAYDLVLAASAVIGVVILMVIVQSTLGRRLIAIREDDELAGMLGINVTGYKMIAFFIGSLFAGIGGALYAPYIGFISPRSFDVLISMNIWLMVAFGGRGTIWGPVIGAVLLAPLSFLLQEYYTVKDVLYGLLIIVVIVAMPGGIAGGFKRKRREAAAPVDVAASRRSVK